MLIRLLTYNIHKGKSAHALTRALPFVRRIIRNTGSDIIFLQEVVGHSNSDDQALPQYEVLADKTWQHFSYAKNAVTTQGHHGNAILSKYPLENTSVLNLTLNPREQRGLLYGKIGAPNKCSLHLLCVHLNLFHRDRKTQYQMICDWIIQNIPGDEALVLAGDFNDWNKKASGYFVGTLGLQETHQQIHGCYAKTFPSPFPFLPLDRIYVRNCQVKDCFVVSHKKTLHFSDHLPLMTELQLNG